MTRVNLQFSLFVRNKNLCASFDSFSRERWLVDRNITDVAISTILSGHINKNISRCAMFQIVHLTPSFLRTSIMEKNPFSDIYNLFCFELRYRFA
jgi:hypothetical protein